MPTSAYAQRDHDVQGTLLLKWEPVSETAIEGRQIATYRSSGFSVTDDPQSPFYRHSVNCAYTRVDHEGAVANGGHCFSVDPDGDAYWMGWTRRTDGTGTVTALQGTGKYEGISGGGTLNVTAPFPGGNVATFDATFRLR